MCTHTHTNPSFAPSASFSLVTTNKENAGREAYEQGYITEGSTALPTSSIFSATAEMIA